MLQRNRNLESSVRFDGFANGLQSEHDISNDSPLKFRRNKRS